MKSCSFCLNFHLPVMMTVWFQITATCLILVISSRVSMNWIYHFSAHLWQYFQLMTELKHNFKKSRFQNLVWKNRSCCRNNVTSQKSSNIHQKYFPFPKEDMSWPSNPFSALTKGLDLTVKEVEQLADTAADRNLNTLFNWRLSLNFGLCLKVNTQALQSML